MYYLFKSECQLCIIKSRYFGLYEKMSQKVQIMRIVQLAENHAKVIISMTISEFYDKIWYGLVDGLADLTNLFSYV